MFLARWCWPFFNGGFAGLAVDTGKPCLTWLMSAEAAREWPATKDLLLLWEVPLSIELFEVSKRNGVSGPAERRKRLRPLVRIGFKFPRTNVVCWSDSWELLWVGLKLERFWQLASKLTTWMSPITLDGREVVFWLGELVWIFEQDYKNRII